MTFNFNKKLVALIIGGLLLIALIIYFIFIYDFNKNDNPSTTPNGPETPAPVISKLPEPVFSTPRTSETIFRDQAGQLAISFAERFGSSSSQSDYGNLSDLEVFMTDAMISRTQAFVAAERAKNPNTNDYNGVTTKAITPTFTSFDATAGTASVTVATKRQEYDMTGETKNYSQNLKLTMKKINDEWKVDSAVWE